MYAQFSQDFALIQKILPTHSPGSSNKYPEGSPLRTSLRTFLICPDRLSSNPSLPYLHSPQRDHGVSPLTPSHLFLQGPFSPPCTSNKNTPSPSYKHHSLLEAFPDPTPVPRINPDKGFMAVPLESRDRTPFISHLPFITHSLGERSCSKNAR